MVQQHSIKNPFQTNLLSLLKWCKHIIDFLPTPHFIARIIQAFGSQGFRHNNVIEEVLTMPSSRLGERGRGTSPAYALMPGFLFLSREATI